ncbi:hypothetical protein [Mangrovicoccus algicola]|uniref:Uncharacterized protein n=1 Tax=Mangrovicoccus algicola TaxID=2771008 RepID=A0A8J7CGQ5_9RHOB|nr:hypothetical protein [Mangrovicoccus algicola]MBE3637365.1 hypothetical protein [Mangrovicoccus algicola]
MKPLNKSKTLKANVLGAVGGAIAAVDPSLVLDAMTIASSATGGTGEIVIPSGQITTSGVVMLIWSVVNALLRLKTGQPVSMRIGK